MTDFTDQLAEGFAFADTFTMGWSHQIAQYQDAVAEGFAFADTPTPQWVQQIIERLAVDAAPASLLDAMDALAETMTFNDLVAAAYGFLVAESVSLGATPTASLQYALQLTDAMALVGGVGSHLNAQITVAHAFALADSLASVYPNAMAETVDLSGSVRATLKATLALMDALRVQGTVAPSVTFLVQHAETLVLDGAASATAAMNAMVQEGLAILGEIRLDDGAYLAWVVNTETRAFVKYRNFPFNSFAKIGDRYFGASADGIYELAGDDDAGTPIEATLRGGLSDLGTSKLKRTPAMYLGLRSDGDMILKVTVTNDEGNREEHWYRTEPRPSPSIRENRTKLGKGLESTYVGWALANVDGGDFDIDSLRWYPVVLERRLP